MRLAFLGTPDAAVGPLRALVDAHHDVAVVVTRPDKRRGRGAELVASPVKAAASELGLEVSDRVDAVLDAAVELGVVVAFGRIIKPEVLARVPMVNLHFSLLPRWRGAAPVERAILAGDTRTGVCLMEVEEGLDTGGVYARTETDIRPGETADELRRRLSAMGTELLVRALAAGLGTPEPQIGEPVYADKIDPEERHLRWEDAAVGLERVVRVGRAWTSWRNKRLLVLRAALVADAEAPAGTPPGTLLGDSVMTGEGLLRLVEVQPEGKAPLAADAWLRGSRPTPGERLGG